MKKKIFISLVAIICVTLAIFLFIKFNDGNVEIIPDEDVKYPVFQVTASNEENNLVSIDTSFRLLANEETSKELVEASFSISPNVEYEIEEIRKDYYALVLKEELKPNSIYNIEYKTNEAPYKWSFQTEKIFDVSNFYPSDERYVSVRSVIEMDFSYIPNDDIKDYFLITPNVDGTFEYDDRRIRFTPKKNFEYATTYSITVKAGFGNRENDEKLLEKNYTIKTLAFEDYSYKSTYIDFIDKEYVYQENKPIYLKMYSNDIKNYDITVYKYNDDKLFVKDMKEKKEYGVESVLKKVDTTSLVKVWEEKVNNDDVINYSWKYALPLKANLEEGYYMILVKANNVEYYLPLQINNIVTLTEYVDNNLLIWVNDLSKNAPVVNAEIKIDDTKIGYTNENGYLFINDIDIKPNCYLVEEIITNSSVKVLYDIVYNSNNKNTVDEYINVYTRIDRKTFKPGEKINIWGFVKDRKNRDFKDAVLKVTPIWSDTVIEEMTVSLDEFKTFETTFDIENYTSGYYDICVYVNGKFQASDTFEVKEYDTNSYDIKVELDKNCVRGGENITCTVSASLFDGTPLADADFVYELNYDNIERKIKLDENGKCVFEIDTNHEEHLYTTAFYGNVSVRAKGIEDQDSVEKYFTIYPNDESFTFEHKFNKADNTITFNIDTFLYDFSDMADVKAGTPTDRIGYIVIEKYKYEKEIISSYYDEDTKTTQYEYRTKSVFDAKETINYTTTNGKGNVTYQYPYSDASEGYVSYKIFLLSSNDNKIIRMQFAYGAYPDEEANNTSDILMANYILKSSQEYYNYKVDDNIVLEVQKLNGDITEVPYILYVIKSSDGIEVISTRDTIYKLKFDKKYGANLVVTGYVFDGVAIRELGDYDYNYGYEYSLSKDELKVDLTISCDKSEYKPGEKAIIKVLTKIDNKPVKSVVNLSAVNKEYLAANENSTNALMSLYNNYYFNYDIKNITQTIISNTFEGGGGGGGDEIRSNFATTAFFETIYTNDNGEAELEVQLPDNVTTWNVSAVATVKDYRAINIDEEIKVSLPFFVTAVMNEKYLTGETPSISLRCNGNEAKAGEAVEYAIEILSPNGEKSELESTSEIGKYGNISLGTLASGTYEITIKATSNGKSDAIKKSIEVVDTFQETIVTTELELKQDEAINVSKGIGTIYFSNESINNICEDLFYLVHMPKVRSDQRAISYLAENILRKLSNEKTVAKKNSDIDTQNGIRLLSTSNPDVLLSAKIASTGYFKNDAELVDYFESIAFDESLDIRERLYAYWGLSAMKEPVLKDLKEIEKDLDVENDKYEYLMLALSYADIGDYTSANKLYKMFDAFTVDCTSEMFEYITMLSFKLNDVNREKVYGEYIKLKRESEYSNFVKLFRIQNEILNSVKDGNVVIELNGEEKKIEINNVGIVKLDVKYSDVAIIKSFTDNVKAKYRRNELIKNGQVNGIVSKTYSISGKDIEDIRSGDIVTVRIEIDYSKLDSENAAYIVEDVLPNSMKITDKYKYYLSEKVVEKPYRKDGQKLYFYVYNNQYIEYDVVVTADGEYISDGVILKNVNDEIVDYLMSTSI